MITTLLLIAGFLGQSEAPPPEIPVHGEPLTLEQALKYAEENNERIGQAHAAVERARAQYWQAMSALLPRLDLSGTYIRRRNEATALNDAGETVFFQRQNALQSIAQLNMSVIRPDQYPRVSAATDEIDASKQDAKNERLQLRFDAAEQFFLLLARQGLADAAKERVRVAQSQVDEARARFEAGLAAANTVTRAELELATAKVTLTQSETEAQLARLQLSFLIGVDVQGELVLPANGTATTSDPDRLIEVARSERPDLRALRYRKDAAESRQLAPLLDWLPELSVRAFYSLTNEPGFGPNDNYNFSATLGWQLFDGGARIAEDIQASADYQDLTLQIRNLERNIRLE
ncbi:MAG: TolC family protein, partial [Myxococcota bacterium]